MTKSLSKPQNEPDAPDGPTGVFELRGQAVILDSDIAKFFGAKTGQVNEKRARNPLLFPEGYAFQLAPEEWNALKSQIAIPKDETAG